MLDDLHKKRFLTKQNYLNKAGQVHFKEKVAGKTSSPMLSRLTGYTAVYVRLILGGFRPVNDKNIVVLETIDTIAADYDKCYAMQ